MHMWGDGFDFARLNEAGELIEETYFALSGRILSWKEKYGTIRYEGTMTADYKDYTYINYEDRHFILAVLNSVQQFPDMAAEIVDDVRFSLCTGQIEVDILSCAAGKYDPTPCCPGDKNGGHIVGCYKEDDDDTV